MIPSWVTRVALGKKLEIRENWVKTVEADPVHHPSNEQPAYSYAPMPDGGLVVNGTRGTYGLRDDGSVAWHVDTGYCPSGPGVAADGSVYVHSALDHSAPDKPLMQTVIAPNRPVCTREIHYVREASPNETYAVTPDGLLLGSAGDVPWWGRSDTLPDGRALVFGFQSGLGTCDPKTGHVEKTFDYRKDHPLRVQPDGRAFWWDDRHLRLVAADGKTEIWSHDMGEGTQNYPQVATAPNGNVYVMQTDVMKGARVTVLSPDGKPAWEWIPKGSAAWLGTTPYLDRLPVFDADSNAYFSGDKCIYAVKSDGSMKWQNYYDDTCNLMTAGPANTLVVSDPSTCLRIVSMHDGALAWRSDLVMGHGYPSTIVRGNDIFTATQDARLASIHCNEAIADADTLSASPEPAPQSIDEADREVIIGDLHVPLQYRR